MARLTNRNSLCTQCLLLAHNLHRDIGSRSKLYRMPAEDLKELHRRLHHEWTRPREELK